MRQAENRMNPGSGKRTGGPTKCSLYGLEWPIPLQSNATAFAVLSPPRHEVPRPISLVSTWNTFESSTHSQTQLLSEAALRDLSHENCKSDRRLRFPVRHRLLHVGGSNHESLGCADCGIVLAIPVMPSSLWFGAQKRAGCSMKRQRNRARESPI